ncbi:MAG: peptidoglycan-binding protein [Ilumatobacteraceae bacterium]|nr:peptidoglycan-binding protein [Ilumatobacter sp.]MCB0983544.1 peptidoglycan-binding protein [Ilumatobacter sp.]
MKHRLLAAITIAATTAIPLLPAVGVAPANAVSCTVTNVLFPPEYPSYTRVALYQNATNPAAAVQCLEQRLNELGYGIGTPDGTYDSTSSAAVRLFQLSRGLYPDGVVSPIVGRQLGLRGPLPAGPSTPTVTIIGDSTSAALRWTDEANNNSARYDIMGTTYDLKWAVESCRRLVNASCSGRTGSYISGHIVPVSVLPLMRGSMSGQLGDAVVIMAGYDDYSIASTIDPIMAEASAQGVTKVFWLNYRLTSNYNAAYQGYYTQHNAALEAAKVRWPNLVVLDWNGYTKSQSYATQQAWFYTDGIHMRPAGATALAEYLKANLDASGLAACTPGEAQAGVPDPTTGDPATPPAALTGFTGIEPTRELDTRFVEYGGGDGMLGAGRTIEVDLSADLPADATAAVVNVTAVTPCSRGYITVFACGTRPDTSNVNYAAWRTTAGLAITPHTDGTICVYSSDATHLIVDLVGAFVPSGALFHPMQPTRWVDTRGNPAVVTIGGPLTAGSQIDIPVAGVGGVDADATAVWVNLTSARSPQPSVLQVYPGPCGTPPSTSTVNVPAGRAGATTALVTLGADGGICVRAYNGTPDVIVDVSGWFGGSTAGGLGYRVLAAERLLDTRPGALPAGGADVPVVVPATAVVNIASVDSVGFGFVSARPCGAAGVSSLINSAPGETMANVGAIAPGTGGAVCVNPSLAGDLLMDLAGVFETVDL